MIAKILCLVVVGATIQSVAAFTELQEEILARHNSFRARHGVPPLVMDEELNNLAQDWSNQCAASGVYAHRPNNDFGESIYWGFDSQGIQLNAALGKSVADNWYSEIKLYNFNSNNGDDSTGHFTQVVWKNSERIGCGCATSPDGTEVYCTCNYDPSGNYPNEFRANVPRPM